MNEKETYWNLVNKELLLEFVEWLRSTSPFTFEHLIKQFLAFKEIEE